MATSSGAVSLDLVAGSTSGFQQSAQAAISKVGAGLQKMFVGTLAVLGSASVAKFTSACVDAAAAAEQTANRLNTVFPESSKAIDNWASDAMYQMGMTAGTAKKITSSFGMMAQGMGYSEKQSAAMSTQMTQLAGDMAAFYGISTDEAQSKLTGIFTGMTRGMKTLGVNMSEANLQAHALSMGISKEVSAMSDAELAAVRLSYAQSQLSKVNGYAQQNLNTYTGQVNLLQQQFGALKAQLGKSMMAAMLPVIKALNAIVAGAIQAAKAFNALIETVTGKSLTQVFGGAQGVVADLGDEVDETADSTSSLAAAQDQAAQAAKNQDKAQKALNRTLAGFDKINKLSSDSSSLGADANTASMAIPSNIISEVPALNQELDQTQDKLNKLQFSPKLITSLTKLKKAFGKLGEVIGKGLGYVWEKILVPLGNWTMNALAPRLVDLLANALDTLRIICEKLAPVLEFIWEEVFEPLFSFIGNFIGNTVLWVLDQLNIAWGDLNGLIEQADFTDLLDALREFKNTNPAAFYLIAGAITAIALALMKHPILALLTGIAFAAKVIVDNWDGIVKFFQGVWDGICKAFGDVKEWFREKFEGAKTKVQDTWKNIGTWFGQRKEDIGNAFKNLKDTLGTHFQNAKTKVQDTWGNIKTWFATKRDQIGQTFSNIKDTLGTHFQNAKTNVQNKWQNIGEWFQTKKNQIGYVFQNLPNFLGSFFGNAWQTIQNKFSNWGQFWIGLWNNVKGRFQNIGTALGQGISGAVRQSLNNIFRWVENVLNSLVGFANSALSLIPGYSWRFSRVTLPRLAQGGFIDKNTPRLAVIGDNRHEGEIVSPESKLQAMVDEAVARAGGNNEQVVSLLTQLIQVVEAKDTATYLDSAVITRKVVSNVNRQTQATGYCPILV